ncbi:hypothetical protein FQN60_002390 [Etheostoma spectabile]|uniref:Transcription initiation factor TFIID subunit 8 n=1 Tax=Etheostoma spectabile TaxID=54343 RepID=A0A5J5DB20_9PERO|nr:hypothetical protein FQN60_002390 [Etheostoma spectabile]
MVITAPPVTNAPVTPKALSAGQKRPHPAYIPSHFPEFPDPHTYIKTPTFREPVSDYQVVREKAAMIAAQPSSIPYLSALLPSELELQTLEETDSSEQDDQTDSENAAGNLINASEDNVIDNPYLRPVKKPKVRRKK